MKNINRIIIFALDYKPLPGGVAEYTHQLAGHLHKYIPDISIFTVQTDLLKDNNFDRSMPFRIERIIPLPEPRDMFQKIKVLLFYFRTVFSFIRRIRPDAVLINHIESFSIYVYLAARLLKIPYYLFTHGLEITSKKKSRFFQWKARTIIRNAEKVFAVSNYTAGKIRDLGVAAEKICVTFAGVDSDFFKPEKTRTNTGIRKKFKLGNRKVILTVSRIIERKGIDTVIRTLPALIKEMKNIVYVIAGDGPFLSEIRELAQELNVQNYVKFLGFITDEIKLGLLRECDLFVMPSRELADGDVEGFGISYLEAMACEKPVIGGRSGGVTDVIDSGRTGYLVDPLDTEELKNRIIDLLKFKRLALLFSRNGRKKVLTEFTWQQIADKCWQELSK